MLSDLKMELASRFPAFAQNILRAARLLQNLPTPITLLFRVFKSRLIGAAGEEVAKREIGGV
jgi:hypothetical protein